MEAEYDSSTSTSGFENELPFFVFISLWMAWVIVIAEKIWINVLFNDNDDWSR